MTILTALLNFSRSTVTALSRKFVFSLHLSRTLILMVLTVLIATPTFLALGLLWVAYVVLVVRPQKKDLKS